MNVTQSGGIKQRFLKLEQSRIGYTIKSLVWDIFGAVGRRFYSFEPPDKATAEGKRYLNLGCGRNIVPDWVNADFFRFHEKLLYPERAPDWMLDLSRPLNCPADHWDGIFVEHTNEHLTYSQNYDLMQELLRVLKPGGRVRLVIPDLDRYLRFEELGTEFPKFRRYASLPEAISNLTQNHAHMSVWNVDLMREMLEEIGFLEATRQAFRVGEDPALLQDSERRRWESLYLEATKPLR